MVAGWRRPSRNSFSAALAGFQQRPCPCTRRASSRLRSLHDEWAELGLTERSRVQLAKLAVEVVQRPAAQPPQLSASAEN